MIFTLKTVVGRENIVIESIESKARLENIPIQSMIHPEEIKGYVFVEGNLEDVEKASQSIPHVRGIIRNPIEIKQIQKFLQPKTIIIELNVGDVVEVVGGPFKGEKGRITRYDKVKREVTIELLEITVPIPVTISVEFVKVLEKVGEK